MGERTIHLCMDVAGFLANNTRKRDYRNMFRHDDGRFMTPDEAKRNLLNCLAEGKRFLPFGECDSFDYQKGCPGHPSQEKA